MTTSFNNKIQSTILLGSVLMISACASLDTGETTHTAIEKGALETPLETPPARAAQAIEPVKTASVAAPENSQPAKSAVTHINQKEPYVNVRTSPFVKSRVVGVLKRGQSIEVLETKDNWVKITWQKGRSVKQGWLKKMFVEGYEQK